MKVHFQRLGAALLTLSLLLGTVPAAFAASDSSFGGNRGDGSFGEGSHGGGFKKGTFGSASTRFLSPVKGYTAAQNGDTCAKSEDTFHVAQVKSRGGGTDSIGAYSSGICLSCGTSFKVYDSDVQRSYGENTEKLPSQGVDSEGYLYWRPTFSYGEFGTAYSTFWRFGPGETNQSSSDYIGSYSIGDNFSASIRWAGDGSSSNYYCFRFSVYYTGLAPVDGYYEYQSKPLQNLYVLDSSGKRCYSYSGRGEWSSPSYCAAGSTFKGLTSWISDVNFGFSYFKVEQPILPVRIKPLNGLIDPGKDPTYSSATRPGSSDFGFYFGDNNKLLSDNTANIVNEVNNTYYNPITNTTNNFNNWSYDYSSRTYTVNNTDNSTTTTITYGDEYVTIKEGDTVYNIYYYVQQDGSQTPATCQHEYTSAVTTAATCTGAGVMTYTCSKCQHSYTEAIPAKGHTWQVAQTVDPEQDAEGNITKKGYTLYRCSVCASEYKDETGTGPPSTPSDSGGGNSILDKLGQLIGSVFGGILEVLGGIISKILDALISLVQMLTDKLTLLVENILKIFDTLPAIFSGFLGFLGAVFGFLPEELLLVLEFGLIAVVFVGILLLIFKR